MKKNLLFLLIFISSATVSHAQCFAKGASHATLGFGLGIQHFRFTDVTNNTVDERGTSAATEFSFSLEYGVLDFLGISLNGNGKKYINGDSTSDKARSLDLVPTINIHSPLGWNKLDPSVSFGYGISHFRYVVDLPGGGVAAANGGVFNFGVNLRWLFRTDGKIGMNFWYEHSSYNYKKGTITDNNGNKAEFGLDGPSNTFGIGLFFRSGK